MCAWEQRDRDSANPPNRKMGVDEFKDFEENFCGTEQKTRRTGYS